MPRGVALSAAHKANISAALKGRVRGHRVPAGMRAKMYTNTKTGKREVMFVRVAPKARLRAVPQATVRGYS